MPRKPIPALSRRMFLIASAAAAGTLALPMGILAAEPEHPAVATLAFDGDALLAGGASLIRSDDGGHSWTELSAPEVIQTLATHSERPGRVLAGLASGGVALSEDGGRTWESRSDGLPAGQVDAVAIASQQPNMIYATVRDDGLWKSEDSGESWSFAMDRPWLEEAERNVLTLSSVDLATGMGGIWIYAGTEAGLTRVPDCFCRWQDVQPGDAMDALVSGDAPPSEAPLPEGEAVRALASSPSAPETLYSALPSGIWTSRDGGVVWSHLVEGSASAAAVHPSDPMQVVAVLDGVLQISRDGGATWTALAVD
ncbi:BNR/Asp-box repeat-containing protein [Palleronia marisminoris]|uniref:WD40/YVTN/BNR-like repeat-containing protein n=1 Tax=Palleronia marisminoris TaxID=315423 RepID=UPI0008E6B11A|nr:sialidase family protein [Palleronia marisminoris]SFH29037.1 BNR/Asp-box repeat-containing protein [Palleronia marisminoris]